MERTDAGDNADKAVSTVITDQCLPVRPVAIFQNAPGQPCAVFFKIDLLGAHVPEQMWWKNGHGKRNPEGRGQASRCYAGISRRSEGRRSETEETEEAEEEDF